MGSGPHFLIVSRRPLEWFGEDSIRGVGIEVLEVKQRIPKGDLQQLKVLFA